MEERRIRARRIADARRDAGLTQQQLADLAGVKRRALQGWESGNHVPQLGQLLRIESELGLVYPTDPPPDLNQVELGTYAVLMAVATTLEAAEPERKRGLTAGIMRVLAAHH